MSNYGGGQFGGGGAGSYFLFNKPTHTLVHNYTLNYPQHIIAQDNAKVIKQQPNKLIPRKKRQYSFVDLGGKPDDREITQKDRINWAKEDRRKEDWNNLLNGINKTFGTAASGASLLYGGGWSGIRLLNGNKASNLGQVFAKGVLPSNKVDLGFDLLQFYTDPSLSNGLEVGVSKGLDKWKDLGNVYRQLSELGSQGINLNNTIKGEP